MGAFLIRGFRVGQRVHHNLWGHQCYRRRTTNLSPRPIDILPRVAADRGCCEAVLVSVTCMARPAAPPLIMKRAILNPCIFCGKTAPSGMARCAECDRTVEIHNENLGKRYKPLKDCPFCHGGGVDKQNSRKASDWLSCRCVGVCPECGTRQAWGLNCGKCTQHVELKICIKLLKDAGYVVYRKKDAL